MTGQTDADGNAMAYAYDDLGRRTVTTYPDTTTERIIWGCCAIRSTQDRLGRVTHFFRDPLQRLIRQRDPRGMNTHFRYDPNGHLIRLTDGRNSVTRWEYDGRNRVTKMVYADGKFERFAYAGAWLDYQINSRGQTIDFGYGAAGNRTSIATPTIPTTNSTFDKMNRLATMTDGIAASTWTRNWQ